MAAAFADMLTDYRKKAAHSFAAWKETVSVSANSTKPRSSIVRDVDCYKRRLFPELREYLSTAAAKCRQAQAQPRNAKKIVRKSAQVLGHGELVVALAASLRKERWSVARAEESQRIRAVREAGRVMGLIAACGIPRDVRENAHKRFLDARACEQRRRAGKEGVVSKRIGRLNAGTVEYTQLCGEGIRADRKGFVQHIERCQDAFDAGVLRLFPLGGKRKISILDTFEEVRKRYAGRPDELYRRKTARRFATWRRQRKQKEAETLRKASRAESEMKRRRGHDHLLTERKTGDSSFAPFLFELDSNTYAFSSRITEAPKLRKVMIEKYSTASGEGEGNLNGWEKAQQAAETNPLFHTRVMNRFA